MVTHNIITFFSNCIVWFLFYGFILVFFLRMTENGWKMPSLFSPTYVAIRIWNSRYVCQNFLLLLWWSSLAVKIVVRPRMKMNYQLITFFFNKAHTSELVVVIFLVCHPESQFWWVCQPSGGWRNSEFVGWTSSLSFVKTTNIFLQTECWCT